MSPKEILHKILRKQESTRSRDVCFIDSGRWHIQECDENLVIKKYIGPGIKLKNQKTRCSNNTRNNSILRRQQSLIRCQNFQSTRHTTTLCFSSDKTIQWTFRQAIISFPQPHMNFWLLFLWGRAKFWNTSYRVFWFFEDYPTHHFEQYYIPL